MRDAQRKAIVFGRGVGGAPEAKALLQAIENLAWGRARSREQRSRVMYLGPQSDSQGALDMGLVPDLLPATCRSPTRRRASRSSSSGGGASTARPA
jgi:predicted molibdopterin-dependent oxidoreductase YjgC